MMQPNTRYISMRATCQRPPTGRHFGFGRGDIMPAQRIKKMLAITTTTTNKKQNRHKLL